MGKTLDACGDLNSADLHLYRQLYDFPEYVKQASAETTLQPVGLPSTAYADSRTRQFPCHTKAACWISALFFFEKQSQIHPKNAAFTRMSLKAFAKHHGMDADLSALESRYEELHKDAQSRIPDSSFAIVWSSEDGRKDRRYPLRDAAEIKVASAWFAEHRDHFVYADRQRIAEKILEKVAEFSVDLDEELDYLLQKQAGRGVYDPKEAAEMIRNRANLPQASTVRERFLKLADAVATNPMLAEDPTSTINLANTIDQFDRSFHVVGKYSHLVPRPEDVLFKGSIKLAGEFIKNACELLTGSTYLKGQFAKLSHDQVQSKLGADIAKAVTTGLLVDPEKMAEVATTLPLPDAILLDGMMAAIGQVPVRHKTSTVGLKAADRAKLAQEYKFVDALPQVDDEVPAPTGVLGSHMIGQPV